MWTTRNEDEVGCDGPLGSVKDGESVARLLIKIAPPTGWQPFKARDFLPPENESISNECGDSHGCSVDRSTNLTPMELFSRSNDFAAKAQANAEARKPQKQVRTGLGAIVAEVTKLRALRVNSLGERQVLYIYADPTNDDSEHAVIRVGEYVLEEEYASLLNNVKKQFSAIELV